MQLNPTTRATVSPYQAKALVLWRAADCGVNGVTDAVYKSKIPGARKITGQATGEKLQWLLENNLLPLAPHQAYGSLFVRSLRQHEGFNPKTGKTEQTLRSGIQEVAGVNVLCLAAAGELLPQDGALDADRTTGETGEING